MARQIQIRRGSAAEHANFTGAIGEITMDTTNKTLRVHDGTTAGGTILAKQSEIPDFTNADYVIETQLPTAQNNYTWYRKYKSGWVEQGGKQTGSKNISLGSAGTLGTINLPIAMANTEYYANATDTTYCMLGNVAKTATTVQFQFSPYETQRALTTIFWEVKGMSATE